MVLSLQALNARIIDDAISDLIFIIVFPLPVLLFIILNLSVDKNNLRTLIYTNALKDTRAR